MPAGLDGIPDPIRSTARDALLQSIALQVGSAFRGSFTMVGVDGECGSGKSTFADELAARLRSGGRNVLRATIDSFHNPRAVRYRKGRFSADGYYRDSHDLAALADALLDPFGRGRPYRTSWFDEPSDAPVDAPTESAAPGSILIFDGLFLHRPELRRYWHLSIFLEAPSRIAARRSDWEAGASADDIEAARNRYLEGWMLYLRESDPLRSATLLIDNDDLLNPSIVAGRRDC